MSHSAGSTLNPLGFFIAPSALGPASPLLADNIDPATRDFRDLFVGADPIDDSVQVAVMTTRGSGGSVLQIGLRLTPRKMTPSLQGTLDGDMRLALRTLTTNRDIRIESITFGTDDGTGHATGEVDEANQSAQTNVNFRNLRSFDRRVRQVQLGPRTQVQVIS